MVVQDPDGADVAKHTRAASAPKMPGAQVTTPHPVRRDLKIDWMWLKLVLLTLVICGLLLAAPFAVLG